MPRAAVPINICLADPKNQQYNKTLLAGRALPSACPTTATNGAPQASVLRPTTTPSVRQLS
jgi:hypothetical protein